MAQFFINLSECGTIYPDSEGRDFASIEAAIGEATAGAREIMAGEVLLGHLCLGCSIWIEDEDRQEVARLPFRDLVSVEGV